MVSDKDLDVIQFIVKKIKKFSKYYLFFLLVIYSEMY
jgi:hypothetical protein